MSVACFVESDLSFIRLVGEGVDETWRAPALTGEGAAVARVSKRARDAASWTAARLGRSHKLGVVVVGVSDAICARVSAPSPAREVVAAALNQREREWTHESGGVTVQPLAPARRTRTTESDNGDAAPAGRVSVIEMHDGPVRLWLDELDRQGVTPDSVATLWHALPIAWRAADGTADAIVLDTEDTIYWSWSRRDELLAGGHALKPAPAESDGDEAAAAPPRLPLDWLSWAAQLGRAPSKITIVSPDPTAIGATLSERWPGASTIFKKASDPLAETLRALAASSIDTDDPRRCVVDLSHRPGRAHRWLAIWSAAAVAMLAVAIGAFGVRQGLDISESRAIATELREQIREQVRAIEPNLADDPSPARALRSVLAREREANKPIAAPAAPYPIFEEMLRFSSALATAIGDNESADVRSIKIDELQGDASVMVPDFATGEAILEQLRLAPGRLRWRGSFLGVPPTTQRLQAVWEGEAP